MPRRLLCHAVGGRVRLNGLQTAPLHCLLVGSGGAAGPSSGSDGEVSSRLSCDTSRPGHRGLKYATGASSLATSSRTALRDASTFNGSRALERPSTPAVRTQTTGDMNPVGMIGRCPTVDIVMNGRKVRGLIDTGSEVTTCLLYTSPSPRDVHKSRMPSSA